MEMEAISNVNANYGTTEVVRTTPKTTTGEVVNVDSPNPALDVPQVQSANAKGNAGQQGGNSRKNMRQVKHRLMMRYRKRILRWNIQDVNILIIKRQTVCLSKY